MDKYEKKYKIMLDRAREYYSKCTTDWARRELEKAFPELRESEDERIRKWLIELVENQEPKMFVEVKKMNVFAWLG